MTTDFHGLFFIVHRLQLRRSDSMQPWV